MNNQITRMCLVRHGETDWNVESRLQGHRDIPLNPRGVRQAQATIKGLQGRQFDALYSSDLTRAMQTAAPAALALALPVRQEPALRERHYGVFQGLTHAQAQTLHPDDFRRFSARELDFPLPLGGESLRAFSERVSCCLNRIALAHAGQTILLVTHGGVLHIANRMACGLPFNERRDYPIPNAALNWLSLDADGWRIDQWADQSHLDEAALDEL